MAWEELRRFLFFGGNAGRTESFMIVQRGKVACFCCLLEPCLVVQVIQQQQQ